MSSPPSDSDDASTSFERLHPAVQRWIWKRGWGSLRPVQEEALPPILAGKDVLLTAPTAGGKTEAAFLPIASRLAEGKGDGLGCLCVSPLKALINDQHRRLEELFEAVHVPVHAWHGDISQARKRKVMQGAPGVLIITPESLEALFVVHGPKMASMWAGLQFIVVDELHAFVGSERGRQLQSLLHRVDDARGGTVPRIGLSATLGDMGLAADFLRPGQGELVERIEDRDEGAELQIQLRGYVQTAPLISREEAAQLEKAGKQIDPEDVTHGGTIEIASHLFKVLRGDHHLVFANSRGLVEQLADLLRRRCERERFPVEFFPHHGSLAKEYREDAEAKLKDDTQPATLIATTTLELGIDVGYIKSVAQVGVPPSVASLRQRLGRSGRREGAPAVLRLYSTERAIIPDCAVKDSLRADLVQATAMVQLLVEEGFCETPDPHQLHLSTLIQQLLSVIAGKGGIRPRAAYRLLCATGPFGNVTQDQFAVLLRALADSELISQAEDGDLVLGLEGEKLTDHYEFYAAFTTPEEYRLVSGHREIGSLPILFPLVIGTLIIFAGQRWRVVHVEESSKTLLLEPASGGVPPQFDGTGFAVDDRIRQAMRQLYESDVVPRYLNKGGRELLDEGRTTYERFGLARQHIIEHSTGVLIFPWMGTRVVNTLRLWLMSHSLAAEDEGALLLVHACSVARVRWALGELAERPTADATILAEVVENLAQEKYDHFLPRELALANYARRYLDVAGASGAARRMLREGAVG